MGYLEQVAEMLIETSKINPGRYSWLSLGDSAEISEEEERKKYLDRVVEWYRQVINTPFVNNKILDLWCSIKDQQK